jgi:hypothetical protein
MEVKAESSNLYLSLKLKISRGKIDSSSVHIEAFTTTKDIDTSCRCRTEQAMKPTSESTRLEGSQGFVEYQAAGKLKDKTALITGGEYEYPSICTELDP